MNFLNIIKYILIGVIQGISEPLPISSSGHMYILGVLLKGVTIDLNFEIIINTASFLAIAIFYRKDIIELFNVIIKPKQKNMYSYKYIIALIIASIPAGIVGILFSNQIDAIFFNKFCITFALMITGLLLIITNIVTKNKTLVDKPENNALIIGLFQSLALLPGISRSGATISAAMLNNVNPRSALKFSFFMYLIASFGATILKVPSASISLTELTPLIISFISAFIATYISISLFKKVISRKSIKYFGYYCITLSIILIILFTR